LVRVMVEAESSDTAHEVAHSLAGIVETSLKL
jgi:phosphoglucosamine mutase